ncbi:uncharacterized protein [Apostichopus japonicus]|uniref:uncharacterized protein isoform X7 n=1 Tax=Stichopus japonicus TaxID=307972 RepID=UPI003AB6072B
MKVSIGHFFGKCLWLFLFFCICLNGHVVNGQTGPILYFLHDMYEVTEGDMNGETKANLTVCQAPNTFQSSASFAFSDGFALSGSDYTATMGSTLLQANVSCTDLQIDITSDNVAEGTEEFTIQLQPALPARVAGFNAAATVTIYDDDNMYTVNFRQISYSVPEGMGSVDLEVCLSPQSPGSFGSVTTFPGTAGVGDADFFPITSLELVFQSGFPCTVVPVIIFEDAIAEADESFTVRLTAVPPAQVQQGYNVATVTILDDDTAPVNTAPELSGCPAGTVADFTTTPSCNDAQDGAPVVTCNPPAGSTFQAGMTTSVSCSCTDSAGLSSNCMFDVFVAPVNTAPELSGCPVGTVASFTTTPSCSDAQNAAPVVTCNPPAGSTFQAGITTSVSCSCTDSAGSTSNCMFDVFALQIMCPSSPLVFNKDPDNEFTTVNIGSNVTCIGGNVNCGTTSFPVGTYNVTCYCFSGSSNDMCDVTIEIKAFILEKWYKRSLLQVSTIATEIGSTEAPATETTSEILIPSSTISTIPTTTTKGMLATDTSQTMMTELSTSVLDVNVTATTIASPTSRPDATETTNMTGMFTTNTTQTMTTGMFTTNTTQTMTTASPTSRPDVTETTKMTWMFTTNTTQTMTTEMFTTNTTQTMTPEMFTTNTPQTMTPDPCLIQPCDGNANCTHNEGLVKCTCKDGFYGDGTINGTGCTGCPRNVPDEKFGLNCSSPCTCASNAECNSETGVCSGGACGAPMPTTCDKNNLTVMILPDDMDVDEKTAFTLFCTVNLGTADVNVTWTYPAGAEIQSGVVRSKLTSFLTVSNAGKEHSGTYTCIARLNKPTETVTSRNDSVNINVRVQGAISPSFEHLRKARIGDDVTLTCEAFGNPKPTVEWLYKNDTNFSGNTTLTSDTPGTCCVVTRKLYFTNLKLANNGTYTCKVSVGGNVTDHEEVDLFVVDFPEIVNLSLQEKSSSSLKFKWTVKDKGNDNITCMANYSEVENDNKMSKICEETSCELSDLSPNTDYIISVVCNNTAGPSNTLNMTSKTSSTVPEEVPDLNVADVNSTFITVTLKPVSTDNGPISCYEFVVAERSEVGTDADNDVPFSSVKENSDDGTPYRAVVMNHDEYTAQKTVMIGAEGNQESTCELPGNSRRKRASELVSSQTLTARNDPLESASNYSIFLRIYVISTNGEYTYSSSDYGHYQTTKETSPTSDGGGALAVVLTILIILIIGIVIAIFFVWRKRSKENHAEQDGEIIALGENGINGRKENDKLGQDNPAFDQTDSSPGINSGFEITVIEKLDPINIDELGNCILTKHQNSNRIFKQEFMSLLDVNKDATHEAFSHETNYQEKNRYINIFCYDHSRVKLEELEGVEQSDYINANYIDGYKQPNKFIAAQGPKTETLEDHWRMIWEQKTATIIMLARCFEDGGREKCAQYWPDEGSQKFGQFTVHLDSTAECSDYLIRKFRVTKEGEEEGTYRSINQFHYLAWPDHGVPEYPYTLLAFVKRIRQMTPPKPEKGNIIVHCSAGVGRTGTYITIDAMLDRLKEEKTVDIYNFVNSMRLNRRLLVQTEVQYTFIHHAMHEEHLYGHTEIPLADLHQYFRRLRLKTHIDDNSPLHNEFKTAATLPIRITKCIDASKEGNKEKNRTRNYLPYDHNRVLLERLVGDENSTYINASYIKGYERKNMYIATQAPMENTVHDFWRLVWESLTATVIMLTDLEEKGNEMCVKFWPEEEPQTFGNLTVELASENEEEDYTVHNFSLSSTEGVSGRKVTMFRFHGWPEVGTPNCCESVIDLVNVAHEHQQNSEREESPDHSRHPIVVFCHTGVGRTAVWIALSILMERARAEGVVDVFQTVRTLRQQRQHMLHDATQYEFLYQAVLKHLDTFDQYANYR